MATTTTSKNKTVFDETTDRARKAGVAYVDTYEKAAGSIADYQESVARQTGVDWISTVVNAQARLTREVAKVQTATARELLK